MDITVGLIVFPFRYVARVVGGQVTGLRRRAAVVGAPLAHSGGTELDHERIPATERGLVQGARRWPWGSWWCRPGTCPADAATQGMVSCCEPPC